VLWRDLTQINAPGCVRFSADTPAAEFWMRRRYGRSRIVFDLPARHDDALAFIAAAQAADLTILVLRRRLSDS
jgi:hypothetical protein